MNKLKTFRTKLWLYFILFSASIFTILGILQVVFMQTFYDRMLINNTKNVIDKIIDSKDNSNFYETIDNLAHNNNILVYITDENSNIIYSADSYKSSYTNYSHGKTNDNPYLNGKELNYMEANYRNLPDDYDTFLKELKNSNNEIEIKSDDLYVYGTYININNNEYILYVSSTLGAVGSTTSIIKTQLVIVSILSLIIGFILSYIISKKVSTPIREIEQESKNIGTKNYKKINNNFCIEFSNLSNTLNEKSDKLLEANNYQKELLSNISHDLRTPLTMIKGYVEMLRDLPSNDKKQRENDINTILKETDRLNNLINEILEYGELESGNITYKFEHINISELTNKVVKQFKSLFESEDGVIETKIDKSLYVNGNRNQIERVIYNLIDNAIRHTGDSKKITIKLYRISKKIKLEVIDYGKGIKEEELNNIWDRYYTSRERKGAVSGLGLSIVKQIVKIHKGKYGVNSKIGEGSNFWVELDSI